jgi:hypothetical protein
MPADRPLCYWIQAFSPWSLLFKAVIIKGNSDFTTFFFLIGFTTQGGFQLAEQSSSKLAYPLSLFSSS